jgi:hypothetical protein
MRKTTVERIKIICEIVNKRYERGNQRRCYTAIWRQYVKNVIPMSHVTFLRLLREGKKLGLLKNDNKGI